MKGFDYSAFYRTEEINMTGTKSTIKLNNKLISGEIFMDRGIWVDLRGPLEIAIFVLRKE